MVYEGSLCLPIFCHKRVANQFSFHNPSVQPQLVIHDNFHDNQPTKLGEIKILLSVRIMSTPVPYVSHFRNRLLAYLHTPIES